MPGAFTYNMKNHDDHTIKSSPVSFARLLYWSKRTMLATAFLTMILHAWAQNAYAVHANIIYRFTKYIDWPEDKKNGDFIIGVLGDTPLYDELKEFTANKTVAGQHILIKKFAPSATAFNCHILFISDEESDHIKKVVAYTAGTPTLLVTETEGVTRKGSCINFVQVDDHLKLEISKTNIEKRNLDIATELLNLAIIVK
jgi:hypothetical protein